MFALLQNKTLLVLRNLVPQWAICSSLHHIMQFISTNKYTRQKWQCGWGHNGFASGVLSYRYFGVHLTGEHGIGVMHMKQVHADGAATNRHRRVCVLLNDHNKISPEKVYVGFFLANFISIWSKKLFICKRRNTSMMYNWGFSKSKLFSMTNIIPAHVLAEHDEDLPSDDLSRNSRQLSV